MMDFKKHHRELVKVLNQNDLDKFYDWVNDKYEDAPPKGVLEITYHKLRVNLATKIKPIYQITSRNWLLLNRYSTDLNATGGPNGV